MNKEGFIRLRPLVTAMLSVVCDLVRSTIYIAYPYDNEDCMIIHLALFWLYIHASCSLITCSYVRRAVTRRRPLALERRLLYVL